MSRPWVVLVGLVLWSCSVVAARAGKGGQRPESRGGPVGLGEPVGAPGGGVREFGEGPETRFLADLAGKKRLWVISAPSRADDYLRMMEKQMEESEGLDCRLAQRDTLIVTIIQNAVMEGKVKYTARQGEATERSLDPDTVTRLLHYLELEHRMFSMLILKKNLKVGERFPYPVRVDAVLEVIDQLPMRKLERVARKASTQKCRVIRKKPIAGAKRPEGSDSRKRGHLKAQREPPDKKTAIRNKIQDILDGRSRFVIRKTTPGSRAGAAGGPGIEPDLRQASRVQKDPENKEALDAGKEGKAPGQEATGIEPEREAQRSQSRKKGNGKKNRDKKDKKKGKREEKTNGEADGAEGAALRELMEELRGRRRLLVISAPSDTSSQYVQQREENERHACDLALRRVSVLSVLGPGRDPTMHLQHYLRDGDPGPASLPDVLRTPGPIVGFRREYGLDDRDFSMVVTDYDLTPNARGAFRALAEARTITEHIDGFESRRTEEERERETRGGCGPAEGDSLLRYASGRRLLIASAPAEDDHSLHQQLQALNGQECHMGVRHFAFLKLVGRGAEASGTVEMFPLNGRGGSETETLPHGAVRDLRARLEIDGGYFSVLVVGKDGGVRAWFPSPVWSLSSIYDLVDATELRQREERLQRSQGIHCPEDGPGGGGGTYHGGYGDGVGE